MTIGQALVLGLVQGITEFLPISSSGHLVLAQNLLGLTEPEVLFDVVVHAGTLLAVIWVFRSDIISMIRGILGLGPNVREGRRLFYLVLIGSIPTALMGFLLKDFFESLFASLFAVGLALLFTGAVLMLTRWAPPGRRGVKRTGAGRAVLVGVAQGLAITPGISRSGTTISAALMLGVDRELAAHYSFLLSIPAILGALLLHLLELRGGPGLPPDMASNTLLAGGAAAALSGYLALLALLRVVRGGRLHWFAPYCWVIGLLAIGWSLWGA